MLEHLKTAAEYDEGREYIRKVGDDGRRHLRVTLVFSRAFSPPQTHLP